MSIFVPEQREIKICLLKSELEEITNAVVSQNTEILDLDEENDRKYHEAVSGLRKVRSLHAEIDRLKMENSKKVAVRVQQKKKIDELSKKIEEAQSERQQLIDSCKQEENNIEMDIQQYEDSLKKKAELFRQTSKYYDQEKVEAEINEVIKYSNNLENLRNVKNKAISELKRNLEDLHPTVPDNLLTIVGKTEIDAKLKELSSDKYEALMEEKKKLQEPQGYDPIDKFNRH